MADANLPKNTLVIDDDSTVGQALELPLSRRRIMVQKGETLEKANLLFNQNDFEVALVELDFEPLLGTSLIQLWRDHENIEKKSTSFVVMIGKGIERSTETLLAELGDIEILMKPFTEIKVLPFLSRGMATRRKRLALNNFRKKIFEIFEMTGGMEKLAEPLKEGIKTFGAVPIMKLYIELYTKTGKYDEALAVADKVLNQDGGNVAFNYEKGRILIQMKRYEDALPYIKRADESAPLNLRRMATLAELYILLKDPHSAVGIAEQLAQHTELDTSRRFDLFDTFSSHGYDREAIELCKNTTEPKEVVRHYNNKAIKLSRAGDFEGAIREYRRALEYFPKFKENFRIHYNIALTLVKVKNRENYTQALESLDTCLEMSPDFEKAINTRETVLKALNRKAS